MQRAVDGIKYLSAKGIFTGDENGNFLPKSMATREAAVAVVIRAYDMLPKFPVPDNKIVSSTAEHPTQKRL